MDEKILKEPSPQRAEMLRTAGFYPESVDYFTQWLRAHPDDAWSLAHRGAARMSVGDHSGAIADLEQAIEKKAQRYPWAFAQKGEAYRVYVRDSIPWTEENLLKIERNIKLSLAAFQQAMDQAKSYGWAFAHKGAMHAVAYFLYEHYTVLRGDSAEQFRAAELCFDTATELNPGYSWAYAFQAVLHGTAKQFESATRLMGKALTVNVNGNLHPHRALAELSYWGGKFSDSLTQAGLARQADAEDTIVLYYIAQSLKATHDPSADAAIDYAHDRLTTLLNIVVMMLAGLHHARGRNGEAKEMIELLLGKQNMESLFIALNDPVWRKLMQEEDSSLGAIFKALLSGGKGPAEGGGQ